MSRYVKPLLELLAGLFGLTVFVIIVVMAAVNTQRGREGLENLVHTLSQGEVVVFGLTGRFPDHLRVERIVLHDEAGAWLTMTALRLDWSPLRLLAGEMAIERLEAGSIAVERLPPPSAQPSGEGFSLPFSIAVQGLWVDRLDLGAPVAGAAVSLRIEGRAKLVSLDQAEGHLQVRRLDSGGDYLLTGRIEPSALNVRLSALEGAQGLLSSLVGMPQLGETALEARLQGPRTALATDLELRAGPLRIGARGSLDLVHESANLTVDATAPAMKPRPGLTWQAISLQAKMAGPLRHPTAEGQWLVEALNAGEVAVRRIASRFETDAGQARMHAQLDGLSVADLTTDSPLLWEASLGLGAADYPYTLSVRHPWLVAEGEGTLAGDRQGNLTVTLSDLKPFAALGGLDLRGHTTLHARFDTQDDRTRLNLDGSLALTGGEPPWPALLGESAKIEGTLNWRGQTFSLDQLRLQGKALRLDSKGEVAETTTQLDWTLILSDLATFSPDLAGHAALQGRLTGPIDALALTADLKSEMDIKGHPRGPVTAQLRLQGLPRSPQGIFKARGELAGSPLTLDLALRHTEEGGLHLTVQPSAWKSARLSGGLVLTHRAELPAGRLDFSLTRLEDLRPWLTQDLSGSLTGRLETAVQDRRPAARLHLEALKLSLSEGTRVERSTLAVTVTEPLRKPAVEGQVRLAGLRAFGTNGSARLDMAGPLDALKLDFQAQLQDAGNMTGSAQLNARDRNLTLTALQTQWKSETLKLLSPARIEFAEGLGVDRLRLGLGQAELEVDGRLSPVFDLTLSLRNLPTDLATWIDPRLSSAGLWQADARLRGSPDHPQGHIDLKAEELRLKSGPAATLPPARLAARASLEGSTVHIDAQLQAGTAITGRLTGQAPFAPSGPLDLRASGTVDLTLLDPMLTPKGRRARGRVTLEGTITGTSARPRIEGAAMIKQGEWLDYAIGAQLKNIAAQLRVEDDTLRLVHLDGRAGSGTITANGMLGLDPNTWPLDLHIGTHNAQPLASDRLTVNLDSDLRLSGNALERLLARGTLRIRRAEIRIPETLPTQIAVLDVRNREDISAPKARATGPEPDVTFDLAIDAPREVFVRGRGMDAELGGKIHLRGTAANPQPDGGLEMRRGQFSLAGKTLIFNRGQVSFDGGYLTDPSLNFIATTTRDTITAELTVAGTARKPKITLGSTPELPQDEILAYLLFNRSSANLGPLEWGQIASGLASLTGVGPSIGDPLELTRKKLGLDRLSLGGTSTGPTLEAGRYVTPGVYVGVRQGISGTTATQATVQVDVSRRLKLEGTTGLGGSTNPGTNPGSSSVGVMYQFEY